jgi:3-hydroxyisobutyrate dehydrogenase-like beta-hydroxyacid dehydrogenase
MVSTYDDVKEVIAGPRGLLSGRNAPRLVIECTSISLEGSAELRALLAARGVDMLAAPVSGNAKVIKAGRLSFVCSGPKAAFDAALPYLKKIGPAASYVGEGELARIVKICHNVLLGVVTQSLAEISVLAQKAGVPRHAFLDFMNQSVMGSMFSRYKTPAFVNLDFKVTFTPTLLRKDLDLGLEAARQFGVPMPLASITRDIVQTLIGNGLDNEDFAKLLVLQAKASGLALEPENVPVGDGLG